jgi:hypothetical protein
VQNHKWQRSGFSYRRKTLSMRCSQLVMRKAGSLWLFIVTTTPRIHRSKETVSCFISRAIVKYLKVTQQFCPNRAPGCQGGHHICGKAIIHTGNCQCDKCGDEFAPTPQNVKPLCYQTVKSIFCESEEGKMGAHCCGLNANHVGDCQCDDCGRMFKPTGSQAEDARQQRMMEKRK